MSLLDVFNVKTDLPYLLVLNLMFNFCENFIVLPMTHSEEDRLDILIEKLTALNDDLEQMVMLASGLIKIDTNIDKFL